MTRPRFAFTLSPTGQVLGADGQPCTASQVDASQIDVPHLAPHVERWTLPQGDAPGVLIRYSCHCWTSRYDPAFHAGELRIMDVTRPRVRDLARLDASRDLPQFMRQLDQHRIYVTASERNYGVYNMALTAPDGLAYTAFFLLRPQKGRFNGQRHRLVLTVESAYHTVQPQKGSKTSLSAVLAAGLRGRVVKYRR